jgi:hypothetical protein
MLTKRPVLASQPLFCSGPKVLSPSTMEALAKSIVTGMTGTAPLHAAPSVTVMV